MRWPTPAQRSSRRRAWAWAFDILVWRSQETNLKLRDLASRFLGALASKASAETQSQVDRALLTLE